LVESKPGGRLAEAGVTGIIGVALLIQHVPR